MKKKVLMAIAIVVVIASTIGLITFGVWSQDKKVGYVNCIPTAYLEPEGYVIARVTGFNNNFPNIDVKYGYIAQEDYYAYLDGKMDGILIIKHPFEEGREVSTPFREIKSIEINKYIF